jgi:hypothetical protein
MQPWPSNQRASLLPSLRLQAALARRSIRPGVRELAEELVRALAEEWAAREDRRDGALIRALWAQDLDRGRPAFLAGTHTSRFTLRIASFRRFFTLESLRWCSSMVTRCQARRGRCL